MSSTVISYPISAYQNVPIAPENYQPSRFVISAITRGITTTITTTVAHNYVIGQLVRLLIPTAYGSFQLNGTQSYVVSIPSTTQVELALQSTDTSAFIATPTPAFNFSQPQILAIGDLNQGAINSTGRRNTGTFIPGSFTNISPQ